MSPLSLDFLRETRLAVLLWINGPFGVGKTTTAGRVRERDRRWRIFDPEWVGYMLRANLEGIEIDDFQDLVAWRALVPAVADEITTLTRQDLIVVQTVLIEAHWKDLQSGLRDRNLTCVHVVLDADERTLETRIRGDGADRTAESWRLDQLNAFREARPWMVASADLVIDTSNCSADEAARQIVEVCRR